MIQARMEVEGVMRSGAMSYIGQFSTRVPDKGQFKPQSKPASPCCTLTNADGISACSILAHSTSESDMRCTTPHHRSQIPSHELISSPAIRETNIPTLVGNRNLKPTTLDKRQDSHKFSRRPLQCLGPQRRATGLIKVFIENFPEVGSFHSHNSQRSRRHLSGPQHIAPSSQYGTRIHQAPDVSWILQCPNARSKAANRINTPPYLDRSTQ